MPESTGSGPVRTSRAVGKGEREAPGGVRIVRMALGRRPSRSVAPGEYGRGCASEGRGLDPGGIVRKAGGPVGYRRIRRAWRSPPKGGGAVTSSCYGPGVQLLISTGRSLAVGSLFARPVERAGVGSDVFVPTIVRTGATPRVHRGRPRRGPRGRRGGQRPRSFRRTVPSPAGRRRARS